MPINLNKFKFDHTKTEQGVWVDFEGDTRFKIASLHSRRFELKLSDLMKPYRSPALRHKLDDQDFMLNLRTIAMAESVLIDWEGIEYNGEPLPFTIENAKSLLTQAPEIRKWIEDEAGKREQYLEAAKGAASENLKSGSALAQ